MEIQGYPMYLIYPDGRVWSKKGKGRFLKPGKCHKGYRHVRIYNDEGHKSKKIHRLVAENLIPNPDNKPQVDHINRIRDDNRVENLRWVSTKKQNENKKLFANNKTGHKKISLTPGGKYYVRTKVDYKSTPARSFTNKIDAICFKFILLLKLKIDWYNSRRDLKMRKHNWRAISKIREPPEGWNSFYYGRYKHTHRCELCNGTFDISAKCLEHDHHSGYLRSICCMSCNIGPMRVLDKNRVNLMLELHRYFNRNN
jgi:hypothetical protein